MGSVGYNGRIRNERAHLKADAVAENESNDLGRRVRDRRKSLRLTQDELADLAGCSSRFVRALEGGKPGVRLDKFLDVLNVLGLRLQLEPRRPA
jgi:HTH-type transcriptional regulator / antitoxin HipB